MTRTTKFKVIFTLYREATGVAGFDTGAKFGVFQRSLNSNDRIYTQTVTSNPINKQLVDYDDNCVIIPLTINIEKAVYIIDVALPWGRKVYQVTYKRFCRNNKINNLINPGETGAAFSVEIFGDVIQ